VHACQGARGPGGRELQQRRQVGLSLRGSVRSLLQQDGLQLLLMLGAVNVIVSQHSAQPLRNVHCKRRGGGQITTDLRGRRHSVLIHHM
jgi:hypothetical protein